MAWFDYNDDGRLDVFMSARRGRRHTAECSRRAVQGIVHDELLVSQAGDRYRDVVRRSGSRSGAVRGGRWRGSTTTTTE